MGSSRASRRSRKNKITSRSNSAHDADMARLSTAELLNPAQHVHQPNPHPPTRSGANVLPGATNALPQRVQDTIAATTREPRTVPGTPRAASVEAPPPLASAPSTTTLASDSAPSKPSLRIIVPECPHELPTLGFGSPLDANAVADDGAACEDSSDYQSAAETASSGSWGSSLPRLSPSSFVSHGSAAAAIPHLAAPSEVGEGLEFPIDDLEGDNFSSIGSRPASPAAPPPTMFASFPSADAELTAFYRERSAVLYAMLDVRAKNDATAAEDAAAKIASNGAANQGAGGAPQGAGALQMTSLEQRFFDDVLAESAPALEGYTRGLQALSRVFLPEPLLIGGHRGVGLGAAIFAARGEKGRWAGEAAAGAAGAGAALSPPVQERFAPREVALESHCDMDIRFALMVEGQGEHEYFFRPQGAPEWRIRECGLGAALWSAPVPGSERRCRAPNRTASAIKSCLRSCLNALQGKVVAARDAVVEFYVDLLVRIVCRIYKAYKK